jgi:hypothetical protein
VIRHSHEPAPTSAAHTAASTATTATPRPSCIAASHELAAAGWTVIHHDIAGEPPEVVVAGLLTAILHRLGERSG